jgi:subtilisin family serine protease/subtilisin-like proprotein convertase family protein
MLPGNDRRNRLETKKNTPRRTLRIEELESRNLMSATLPAGTVSLEDLSIDTRTYNDDYVLVRFNTDAPTESATHLDLGNGLFRIDIAEGQTVAQAVSYYESLTNVDYATPDYRLTLQRIPNDPRFSSLYGLNNTGQNGGTVDADIDAPEAWDRFTGSGNLIIAVIDTGVDYNHPDLRDNMWRNPGEIPGNGRDDDGNGFVDDIFGWDFANNDNDPMDDEGHGTHCAGTIAAQGNNGIGVTGVIWDAQIMALKFLGADGSGSTSDAVRCLNYAVANGARISNNSYGGGGFLASFQTALQNARARGHLFIAAAGNETNNNDANASFPANYNVDNVVSVAATDNRDRIASFSNFGATTVDIAAPGVNILSTLPGGGYGNLSGTSMAAPHVAGAAALVWDANPALTYTQVISRLYNNADRVASLTGLVATGARLNVNRALVLGSSDSTGPRVTSVVFAGSSATAINSATITFSEAIQASSFTAADLAFTGPAGPISITSITQVGTSRTVFRVNYATQTASGTYSLVIGPQILDDAGNAMDQNMNGVTGETADRFTAQYGINPIITQTFTSNTQVAILDNATVIATLPISSTATVRDINVRVNLTHTFDGDLILTLISPAGIRVPLVNRRGGIGDNFTNTVFDDEAATSITTGAAPFTGTFRPEAALSAFDNRTINGTWRLEIRDAAPRDVGRLLSWAITAQLTGPSGPLSITLPGDSFAEAELDPMAYQPGKEDFFEPIASPISLGESTSTPVTPEGLSTTPTATSVTWLTSDTVADRLESSDETIEITIDSTDEEGVFSFSFSDESSDEFEEETELDLPAVEEVSMDLLGVELM